MPELLDFAALWRRIAADHPGRTAIIHGPRHLTWREFDARAATLAAHLRGLGLQRGDVAALALPNRPEHLVCLAACLRIGLTPANVNYRYRSRELAELLTLLAPAAVFFATEHHPAIATARIQLPGVRTWIATGRQDPPVWAHSLERILSAPPPTPADDPHLSSPDDVLIKCTGGTTGRPAAFRWRVGDLAQHLGEHNPWQRRTSASPQQHEQDALIPVADARLVVASPLMHGSGQTRALGALCAGGTVITMPRLGPSGIWETVARTRADTLAIVGDPMARPLADALHRLPGRWDLSCLTTITSSGASWSDSVKQQLLTALPHLHLVETIGATEATGLGTSTAVVGHLPPTGQFTLGRHAAVLRPDGTPAAPGETGLLAVAAPHPAGLHPTGQLPPERFLTAEGGQRYLLSGDHARLLDGQHFRFLGRQDDCITIGGEKVYGPEVAEVLLGHPRVQDAAVLPVPHPVLGNRLAALVQLAPGADMDDVRAHAGTQLADYKIPRIVVRVTQLPRSDAGKLDIAAATAHIERAVQAANPPSEELAIAPQAPSRNPDIWQHLTGVAEREQLLLEEALASLFTDPVLDADISKALQYPDWPQPLTLLPALAPELARSTEALSHYIDASALATSEVIEAVARHGWPRTDRHGHAAVDATWILMQHADLANDHRTELLAEVTRTVASGHADPRHLALLADRIQSLHGKPQRYGTFLLVRDDLPRFLYPLDGTPDQVDQRRRIIGLPSLSDDWTHAYSPITPYGAGRTTVVNPFTSHGSSPQVRTRDPHQQPPAEPTPAGRLPVYLAATLRHRNEVRRLRENLPSSLHCTARWLDIDPLTRASCQHDAGIALNRLAARLCLDDVRRSRLLIAIAYSRRSPGLSVEIGCALASGIPVLYVGEPSCSFDMLPEVTLIPDIDTALETASAWAGA